MPWPDTVLGYWDIFYPLFTSCVWFHSPEGGCDLFDRYKKVCTAFSSAMGSSELLLRYLYGQEGCSTLRWLIIVGAGAQCWELLTPFCHAYGWKRHTRKWNNTTAEGTRVPVREESHVRKWEPIWDQCRISRNISKISSSVESAGM